MDGQIKDLASGLPGANSIAFTRDGKRLFVGQVFMGDGMWEIDLAGSAAPRLVAPNTGGINDVSDRAGRHDLWPLPGTGARSSGFIQRPVKP